MVNLQSGDEINVAFYRRADLKIQIFFFESLILVTNKASDYESNPKLF